MLLFIRDFGVYVYRLKRDRVICGAVMQLSWVVQVDFENKMLFLIIPMIARRLVLQFRNSNLAIFVAYSLKLDVRQQLQHCPTVKVVGVHVHSVGRGLDRTVKQTHYLFVRTGVSD